MPHKHMPTASHTTCMHMLTAIHVHHTTHAFHTHILILTYMHIPYTCTHLMPTHATPTVHAALPMCNTFGNNLVQATGTQASGLYLNISNAASCAGNATAWNVCYYSNISDAMMTSYFSIYRLVTGSFKGNTYTYYSPVGSYTTYNAIRNISATYVCDHIPIPQSRQYMVQPQDVLAVCLKSVGSGYQGMVASPVASASVLRASSTCTSGSAAFGNSLGNWNSNTVTSTTLHISIGTWNHWVHFASSF